MDRFEREKEAFDFYTGDQDTFEFEYDTRDLQSRILPIELASDTVPGYDPYNTGTFAALAFDAKARRRS